MEQKERLIEILSRYFQIGDSYAYNLTRDKEAFSVGTMDLDDFEEFDEVTVADIAEYLTANGVIAPPCKVGDTVYIPLLSTVIEKKVFSIVVQKPFYTVYCGGTSLRFSAEDFGKNVFFTREEAEKVIAERGK